MHSDERAARAVEELSRRIHAASLDGGLDAEPVVELACLLYERGVHTSAVQELLERPAAGLAAHELIRLGEEVLRDVGSEVGARWWAALEQALTVVARDLEAAGIAGTLRLVIPDWDDSGQAWVEFQGVHHGNGIRLSAGSDPRWALASVAGATQEVVMETIWRVWPVCAEHGLGLHVEPADEVADEGVVWRCAGAGAHVVAPVGELPVDHRADPARVTNRSARRPRADRPGGRR
ncbi:hypothetical protein Sru01_24540 [Sphaerisporangium rufum]|uniref:Uncharacterized protein n=1 Tax=Sphaerisporangium rufum TaxID=1381558 RepID=A0A919V0I6_9ACTN|nr:hypothetical protein [Sphaerisporangium rufum]GII77472.1 hypothetical protein Sru01_24540 [Sphaerisporangium rufum]